MGAFPSHELLSYQTEGEAASDSDYRGSLRMLTGMLTRQHAAKKHRGKLLLLGLDGAGKSTLVNHLSRISIGDDLTLYTAKGLELPSYLFPEPTKTLQTASYRVESSDRYLQLVNPPGRRSSRAKWYSATGDFASAFGGGSSSNLNNLNTLAPSTSFQTSSLPIVAVLFVVDASDAVRFPLVASELIRFLKHRARTKVFSQTQLLLVFNKTDRFLPPLPAETPEEPQSKEYQQLLNNRKQLQRAALQEARRELRKCVDFELKMDQRRHPVRSRDATGAAHSFSSSSSSKSKGVLFTGPAAVAAELGFPNHSGRRNSHSSGGPHSSHSSAVSSIFTNVVECCAQDRDSVRALRNWLNDELKKTSSPS
ncbi:hypothetical protein PHYSODRAFT_485262 [Phytophthora sojae]|uniref:G domain-containing protein n=1 Tax=Phytophthora sojae (strain P6497) TaxID=1094619 RepID=G4YTD3_PHYSP|nr:hypothetical protein PHYSODRAFT_485262 [Phytophthora sojae]EGZ23055.1 hypothetical protein PHYSODRAFT_485262 [Phytophthora sojae]|eukprot:XP_009518343.1 hypothetical protein PHYSODRAFT_485262 [Phytophthora sojae]